MENAFISTNLKQTDLIYMKRPLFYSWSDLNALALFDYQLEILIMRSQYSNKVEVKKWSVS